MENRNYDVMHNEGDKPIKMWTQGVQVEEQAKKQLANMAKMPFIYKHVAVMPDVHLGMGATVGSVVATQGAIIPAAVGVDIGCGMIAVKTTLTASDLPDNLGAVRAAIERAVPHGRVAPQRGRNVRDTGSWENPPRNVDLAWAALKDEFEIICQKNPHLVKTNNHKHLGTLGTGNHFVEICLDENQSVWIMLHSGSRGVGNSIGSFFIEKAKKDMERWFINLPDKDLAYFPEGSDNYNDYVQAVNWGQKFAKANRECMMENTIEAIRTIITKPFETHMEAINCHHNYVQKENHFGTNVLVTRKGAVSAREGQLGIIPGSMGAKSFIVRGKGNPDSFNSCSHGAGRKMSRTEALKTYTVEDHIKATEGVECRKDASVVDETPMAYKDIDDVMHAQRDLVEVVYTLKQVVCVKG